MRVDHLLPLVVVSTCSATKRFQPPNPPGFEDLVDPKRRAEVESRLSPYALPAREMYAGRQHRLVMKSVDRLRAANPRIDLFIVSAGYGLLTEQQRIVPYEARFSRASRRTTLRRARQLHIRTDLQDRLRMYAVAIFLLSDAYLAAIEAPLDVAPLEVYLASPHCELRGERVIHVPVGAHEARLLGDSSRTAKATLFARFADAVLKQGWVDALASLRSGALIGDQPLQAIIQQPPLIAV